MFHQVLTLVGMVMPAASEVSPTATPTAVPPPAYVPVTADAWASVMSKFTAQISPATIVAVLVTLVTAGIGLVFMWWGVRKAARSLMAAFRKGKMSI